MYNPMILMYDEENGPSIITLQMAKSKYGYLPSDYKLLSSTKLGKDIVEGERTADKVLNLGIGVNIRQTFNKNPQLNLKGFVYNFHKEWHRDYAQEFGLSTSALFNLNDGSVVKQVLKANEQQLENLAALNTRKFIEDSQAIRKDVLNSIPDNILLDKCITILSKKICGKRNDNDQILLKLQAKRELNRLCNLFGNDCESISSFQVEPYADEIALYLSKISKYSELQQLEKLQFTKGVGVEFEYMPRDKTYLKLGRVFGDCTSDQRQMQTDRDIENIYWTVFSWILDKNYQIIRVLYDGVPVLKCHLTLLTYQSGTDDTTPNFFLSVDAIEATSAYSRSIEGHDLSHSDLNPFREKLMEETFRRIISIADKIGVNAIFSEPFSNAPWVRNMLASVNEIYLDTHKICKLDGLEDVYECAKSFCKTYQYERPQHIFMELQAKNTYLMPDFIFGSNKIFAEIRGDKIHGLSMKEVYGI